jgi:hypothetical protein
MNAEELLAKAEVGMQHLVDSGEWERYLSVVRRFHNYSWGNQMLIWAQRPDATRVAGYRTWQKLGRQVKAGSKGIGILAPMPYRRKSDDEDEKSGVWFKAVFVFDVSDTEGEDLPTMMIETKGDDGLLDLLEKVVAKAGLDLVENNMPSAWGWYSSRDQKIAVSRDKSQNQQAQTIAHELGHWALGHSPDDGIPAQVRELEAESVAYLICQDYGLDVGESTWAYLLGWARDVENGVKLLGDSMDRINKAYAMIKGMA